MGTACTVPAGRWREPRNRTDHRPSATHTIAACARAPTIPYGELAILYWFVGTSPTPNDPDFSLLEAWRAGEIAAGEALFRRHFAGLCRFFRNKVADGVDDLIQRTFLRCVENIDAFEGRSSFRTYLFVIARHELYRELDKRRRSEKRIEPLSVSVQELSPSPPSIIARKSDDRVLLEALRQIPLEHQITLELYFWEDMTAAAIGEVLELPEGTVRTRIRRARALLAERLEELDARTQPLATTAASIESWARSLKSAVEST